MCLWTYHLNFSPSLFFKWCVIGWKKTKAGVLWACHYGVQGTVFTVTQPGWKVLAQEEWLVTGSQQRQLSSLRARVYLHILPQQSVGLHLNIKYSKNQGRFLLPVIIALHRQRQKDHSHSSICRKLKPRLCYIRPSFKITK